MAWERFDIITLIRCICWLSSALPPILAFVPSVEVGDATSGWVWFDVSGMCLDQI